MACPPKTLLEYARHNPAVPSVFKKTDKKISEVREKAQMFWQGEMLPGSRNIFLIPFCLENAKTVCGRGRNQREKANPSLEVSLFPFFLKKERSLQVRKKPPVRGRGRTQRKKANPSRKISLSPFFLKKERSLQVRKKPPVRGRGRNQREKQTPVVKFLCPLSF